MGYQESLIHIKPQRMFKTMIEAYAQAEKSGYYHCANVEPLSVITLKQQMFGYPPQRRFALSRGLPHHCRACESIICFLTIG